MESYKWIDLNFSPIKLGSSFESLLRHTQEEYTNCRSAKRELMSLSSPPTNGLYEIASGYHLSVVDWDTPWTWIQPDGLEIIDSSSVHRICWSMLLMDHDGQKVTVLALPAVYDDGNNQLHHHCP